MPEVISISNRLLSILGTDPGLLTRLSTHDHACNFQSTTGALVAFVTPAHGNGPFHLVVSPRLLSHIRQQPTLTWQDNTLTVGPQTIALGTQPRWEAMLPALQVATSTFFPLLYTQYRQQNTSALGVVDCSPGVNRLPFLTAPPRDSIVNRQIHQRTQQATTWLSTGLYENKPQLVMDGTKLLAGLGPGLTPAGDDFLVGLLAAGYALSTHATQFQRDWPLYTDLIVTTASDQTTRLSAAWLTYAGMGAFGEAWHQLIHAINHQQQETISTAANRILTTGATSGADAMGGFLWGVALLERMSEEKRGGRERETG